MTVPTDPTLIWVQPAWLVEATAWVRARLAEHGLEPTGEIEQPHVRWWSTVLRVPTARATSGSRRAHRRTPSRRACSPSSSACVPATYRSWSRTTPNAAGCSCATAASASASWSTRHDLTHWQTLLPAYAELQIALAPHIDELLEAQVPDERLAVLPGHVAALLDDREACMVGRENGLTEDEHERLRALVPDFAERCARLAAYGIPETIQHDDLHDGNVFVRDGRYLFFDWGDSCVSHPFNTLVVTMRSLVHRLELAPGGPDVVRLRDAYLEPFAPLTALTTNSSRPSSLAHYVGTAERSLSWNRFIRVREPEYRFDDEDAVPYGLKRLLDIGPLGSWS